MATMATTTTCKPRSALLCRLSNATSATDHDEDARRLRLTSRPEEASSLSNATFNYSDAIALSQKLRCCSMHYSWGMRKSLNQSRMTPLSFYFQADTLAEHDPRKRSEPSVSSSFHSLPFRSDKPRRHLSICNALNSRAKGSGQHFKFILLRQRGR